jgi:Fur family peroxide stress response transcriptional regulator
MNYSRQREIIYDTLARNAVHPTADKLYEIIKKENPNSNIGIATVYRNLKVLSETGQIKRISGLEESEHFDHNTHTHYHVICKKCGKVYDVDSNFASNIINEAEKQTGYIIDSYDIVFRGICDCCQKK